MRSQKAGAFRTDHLLSCIAIVSEKSFKWKMEMKQNNETDEKNSNTWSNGQSLGPEHRIQLRRHAAARLERQGAAGTRQNRVRRREPYLNRRIRLEEEENKMKKCTHAK